MSADDKWRWCHVITRLRHYIWQHQAYLPPSTCRLHPTFQMASTLTMFSANTKPLDNVVLMLVQRRRRWTNIKTALFECIMVTGKSRFVSYVIMIQVLCLLINILNVTYVSYKIHMYKYIKPLCHRRTIADLDLSLRRWLFNATTNTIFTVAQIISDRNCWDASWACRNTIRCCRITSYVV